MSDLHWETKLSIASQNKVLVRGYNIEELMGNVSFTQAIWLDLMGELPDENLAKLLDVIFVSCIDHGPSSTSCISARVNASTGAPLNASIATGLLGLNKYHGAAIEDCYLALDEALQIKKNRNLSFEDAAEAVISEYKSKGKRIGGFGHPLHKADPRSARLLEICEESGLDGDYVKLARALENAFSKSGKPLPMNITGALGAVLGDLGVPHIMMNGFFMISRVPGLVAHITEEMTNMRPIRKIHPTDYSYTGPDERHPD